MSTSTNPPDLAGEVRTFVTNLTSTVRGSLPSVGPAEAFVTLVDPRGTHITIRQDPPEGFAVTVEGQLLLDLKVSHRCVWNSDRTFLSVERSEYVVLPTGLTEPLFRYHFERHPTGGLPSAHLHVHAHRDELVSALLGGSDRGRVRARLRRIQGGDFPRLAMMHFPLGGPRFRTSLEDIIAMMHVEFEIDLCPGWADVLDNGRRVYRQMQLASAVGDDPLTAAAELERLGFTVSAPDDLRELGRTEF